MKSMPPSTQIWPIRTFIYRHIAETTHPPTVQETAVALGISEAEARAAYTELNERHAIFLDPATGAIQMANPFSGVPTPFRVHAQGKTYFANCAWDALGIPAALQCEAEIEATCAGSGEALPIRVRGGRVEGHGELVHFLVPFREWYADMTFT